MTVTQRKSKKTAVKAQKTAKTTKTLVPAKVPVPATQAKRPAKQAGERFVPTADHRKLVMLGCGIGMTREQICALVDNPETGKPISIHTLDKHFPDELAHGRAKVLAKVAGNLITIASDKAHKNTVTAAIFYLKAQAQWREPEPASSELRRLQAQVQADVGDRQIDVTLVLEERPAHIIPQEVTEEDMRG